MFSGNLLLVLHTHLPYVLHHGTWPHGTDWLCEAVAECYIPLMNALQDLSAEGINSKLTIDISPVLCEQLAHPDFTPLFIKYCDTKIQLAAEDARTFRKQHGDPHQVYLAHFWQEWYAKRKNDYLKRYNSSIINGLKELQEAGSIEIITCGATHGYMPLLGDDKSCMLQMKTAVQNYQKHFGCKPKGTWIPECAYRPSYPWRTYLPVEKFSTLQRRAGVEEILAANELQFFFVDQHLATGARHIGSIGADAQYKPLQPNTIGVPKGFNPMHYVQARSAVSETGTMAAAFPRHQKTAMQVWSGESGYPGDPAYLDFHKKHFNSALRYWRVTDNKADMMYKLLYVPDWIPEKIGIHAYHFIKSIETALSSYKATNGRNGMLCLPFDTELFGHWWFEGPQFIKAVLRGIHHSPYVNAVTVSQHMAMAPSREVVELPEGSWGRNGHHEVWMSDDTKWTWQIIYECELLFDALMQKFHTTKKLPPLIRIMKQAMRELLLLQSSDWQFLISTFSAKDYAEQRFSFHYSDFKFLCEMAGRYEKRKTLLKADRQQLEEIEKRNAIFPEIELDWWQDLPSVKS
jgi:1,4-alpha-glucan branching enzyme